MAERDKVQLTLSEFKAIVRTQYFILLIDEAAALAAMPKMLPPNMDERRRALAVLRKVASARGEVTGEVADRLERMARLFEHEGRPGGRATVAA
jgi:hypothetical protein